MKRFYTQAGVEDRDGLSRVVLDGRSVRTPAKRPLALPSRPLAVAIAAEWQAQGQTVEPATMPLNHLAATVIDGGDRARVIEAALAFGRTDLVCYRVDEPAELAARQAASWQPLVDWAGEAVGAPLTVTTGLGHVTQPVAAERAFAARVGALDDFTLGALHLATAAAGSLVIGLALIEDRIGPEEAFAAGVLEESYQIERWGEDEEAALRRRAIARDLVNAATFARLARG